MCRRTSNISLQQDLTNQQHSTLFVPSTMVRINTNFSSPHPHFCGVYLPIIPVEWPWAPKSPFSFFQSWSEWWNRWETYRENMGKIQEKELGKYGNIEQCLFPNLHCYFLIRGGQTLPSHMSDKKQSELCRVMILIGPVTSNQAGILPMNDTVWRGRGGRACDNTGKTPAGGEEARLCCGAVCCHRLDEGACAHL